MSEFVQVIRVDSKFRSNGTGSSFDFELADNLQCGQNTVCHVSAVSFPVSMFTIEAGVNDRLYYSMTIDGATYNTYAVIPPGQYDGPTFGENLQTELNNLNRLPGWPQWTVFSLLPRTGM